MDDSTPKPSRIAVIAVHGVADQQPRDTARTAADMLLRAERVAPDLARRTLRKPATAEPCDEEERKPGHYQGFEQKELRIGVTALRPPKLDLRSESVPAKEGRTRTDKVRSALSFRQQPQTVVQELHPVASETQRERDRGKSESDISEKASAADEISLRYLEEQLAKCVIAESEATYETIQLESVRIGSRAHVHVFEMYWADLSRPVGSWFRWLMEFYQLLFNLCLLGRKSLDFARAEYEKEARDQGVHWAWLWPVFGGLQAFAEQLLALFIPLLNLYLLGIATAILPLLLPDGSIHQMVAAIVAVAVALVAGFLVFLKRQIAAPSGRPWPILIVPLLLLGGLAAFVCLRFWIRPHNALMWAVAVWWVVPLIAITWLMASYQKSRPGALPLGLIVGFVVTAIFGYELWGSRPIRADLMNALLRSAERTLTLLSSCWTLLIVSAFLATIAGFFITKAVPNRLPPDTSTVLARDKIRRAAWTANLTLVLPALTVLILNLTLWQAIIATFVPDKVPGGTQESTWNFVAKSPVWQVEHKPILKDWGQRLVRGQDDTRPPHAWEFARALMAQSRTPVFFAFAGLFCLAALLLVWSVLPAVIGELWPGAGQGAPPAVKERRSNWLGESLSSGIGAMRVSGEIVRWAFLLLPVAIAVIYFVVLPRSRDFARDLLPLNEGFLYVGVAIVVGIVASRGPFKALALGLRAGLDVALDVINWLRLHPLETNTMGRICARFFSLLRHVEEWRDPADVSQGFQAIVILAHSQGTVITADLLRYLKHEGMSLGLPIYLFTMGCPLRQLYSLRFPHLYGWARHADTSWAGSEPHPDSIGVELWVNAYRSGDYVGRHLWHPDRGQQMWSTRLVYADGPKREFCIGAGAHTHYWDDSAPEIAVELDRLVGIAAR